MTGEQADAILAEMMSWEEWRELPVTRGFLRRLAEEREAADGVVHATNAVEYPGRIAYSQGQYDALTAVLEYPDHEIQRLRYVLNTQGKEQA